ncbi:MAG: hypothetical protein ACLU0O_09140 [Collinsella sp.]
MEKRGLGTKSTREHHRAPVRRALPQKRPVEPSQLGIAIIEHCRSLPRASRAPI